VRRAEQLAEIGQAGHPPRVGNRAPARDIGKRRIDRRNEHGVFATCEPEIEKRIDDPRATRKFAIDGIEVPVDLVL